MRHEPLFLTFAEVIEIHDYQIEHFGGGEGLRYIELLKSAIGMRQQHSVESISIRPLWKWRRHIFITLSKTIPSWTATSVSGQWQL